MMICNAYAYASHEIDSANSEYVIYIITLLYVYFLLNNSTKYLIINFNKTLLTNFM